MDEFRERLKKLKEQRKQASHSNFREVLEENQHSKRPANWEKKLERNLKQLEEEKAKQEAEQSGQDYELKKSLNYRADEIEKWNKMTGNKRHQDDGCMDFEEASKRQYGRSIKQLKPDLEAYNALKEEIPVKKSCPKDNTDGTDSTTCAKNNSDAASSAKSEIPKALCIKDSKEGVERMVEDVNKQIEIRSKRSRRRRFDDGADVDYINERNMKFNKKLERYYGEFTDEIKKNFERGTAM